MALLGVGGLLAVLAPVFAAPPAMAAVPFETADFSAYGHGSLLHLGAVTLGDLQVAKADLVPASALVNSRGVGDVRNTNGLPISRNKSGGVSNARANANAAAVGAGLLAPPTAGENINLTGLAAANAPPPSADREEIDVDLEGILEIPLLRSFALANFLGNGECFLGGNLTAAGADATEAEVLNTVVQSPQATRIDSGTRFVPQTNAAGTVNGPDFGLAGFTQQELAPINLVGQLLDVPDLPINLPIEDIATVELDLGQWALQAVATGLPGGAFFKYGPVLGENTNPTVLTVKLGNTTLLEVKLNQIVGPNGFDTSSLLGGALDGILDIEIGKPPTTTLAGDGTFARAVADIVKGEVLMDGQLLDLQIGHQEAQARVPVGGIQCTLKPTKSANPNPVTVGNNFVYTLSYTNPNACVLRNVVFNDVILPNNNANISYEVVSTQPTATSVRRDGRRTIVVFNLPDIAPGRTGTAQIVVKVNSGPSGAELRDELTVSGTCGVGSGVGSAVISVPVSGTFTLIGPRLGTGSALARTGEGSGLRLWLAAVGLLSFVFVERIRRRLRTN